MHYRLEFVLPQKGAAAHIYFADESPYTGGGVRKYQNISLLETSDGDTFLLVSQCNGRVVIYPARL